MQEDANLAFISQYRVLGFRGERQAAIKVARQSANRCAQVVRVRSIGIQDDASWRLGLGIRI